MKTREQLEKRIDKIQAKIDNGSRPDRDVRRQARISKIQARIDKIPAL